MYSIRIISIALALLLGGAGEMWSAPAVTITTPAPGAVSALQSVAITFSEAVTGVDAGDLLINGEGAQTVAGSSSGPYTFTFSQPPPGAVSVAWSFDHQITGVGTGAFVEGSGWSYTLTDTVGPTVRSTSPPNGAVVGVLSQVEVTFSEDVIGVSASDLRINGVAAATVAGSAAGPYVFNFPQPAAGAVTFQWAAGHGITDTAPAANDFAGGSWTVTRDAGGAGTLRISEFLAANATGLLDADGDTSAWIEIQNAGAAAVNLAGWSLTNETGQPGLWVFPNRTLNAGAFLVVFASGKDRRPVSGELHTNFKLNENGEYLALFPPDLPRTAATEFAPFPAQRFDFSYGRLSSGALVYFSIPTPGGDNSAAGLTSLTPSPVPSVGRGFFQDAFSCVLSCPDAAATIRYTLDGSVPTAASPAYTAPLAIAGTTLLRMAALGINAVPSEIVTHSYVYLDQALAQPSPPYDNPARTTDNTNPALPTVGGVSLPIAWGTRSGFTGAQAFPSQITNLDAGEVPADYGMDPEVINDATRYADSGAVDNVAGKTNLERIRQGFRDLPILSIVMKTDDMFGPAGLYPNSRQKGTAFEKLCSVELLLPDGSTGFATSCGIRIHGNASRDPENCPKHGFKLNFKGSFGANNLDYALFPDSPVRKFDDLILRADHNSSWTHWGGDTVNDRNSQRPKGTRIRDAWSKDTFRAMGRAAAHARYTHLFINGLYWGTYDASEQENDGFAASYLGGEEEDYDVIEQGNLKSGTLTAYNAMTGMTGLSTNAKYEAMKQYLDVPWFIDYMLLHFLEGHEDWGTAQNWIALRNAKAGGTFKYVPWDMENLLWGETKDITGLTTPPSNLHSKLVANAEYKLDFADRAHRHMIALDGALLPAANIARWNKWRGVLVNALANESARWGDYRRDVHQWSIAPYLLCTWNGTAAAEHNRLLGTYFPVRTANVLTQLRARGLYPSLNAPEMRSQATSAVVASQPVSGGFQVKFTLPTPAPSGTTSAGTVYYTTNGIDPRVTYTGVVAASAAAYTPGVTAPLTINTTMTIKARVLSGTTWSALNEQTFTVEYLPAPVRITEIMYHPTNGQGGDAAEFVEVQNTGTRDVEMSGWSFDGISFIFPQGFVLAPGARAVIASNAVPATFSTQYPSVAVAGYFGGSLDNGGERLALLDASGRTLVSVDYDDQAPWPTTPDGAGFSLEIIDPNGDADSPVNWRASNAVKGTPGQANSSLPASSVVLNEVLAANAGAVVVGGQPFDFIELRNSGGTDINLQGWTVSATGGAYTFSAVTTMTAGSYLVLPCSSSATGVRLPTALSDASGFVQLKNAAGVAVDAVSYGPQIPNLGIGRVANTWTLTNPTVGAANAAATLAPASGNLVLNEWLADAAPGGADWLEIYNKDATRPVALQGLVFQTDTQLYRYPTLSFLAPQSWLQLFCDEQPGANQLDLRLPATGTALAIVGATGSTIDSVSTSDFGLAPQGVSRGRMPDGAAAFATFANSSSPGAANYTGAWTGPVLNEIVARNQTGALAPWGSRADWVELRNLGASEFNLAGLKLGVVKSGAAAWTFPAGASISAGGFLAVWCDPTQSASASNGADLNTALNLGDASGGLYLFTPSGQLADSVEWGFEVIDTAIGRLGGAWQLQASPTRGSENSAAATLGSVTGLKINEWNALPVSGGDWFEIFNSSSSPVDMAGLYLTDDPSEIGRSKFAIPLLSFISPGGWVKLEADSRPELGSNHVNFGLDGGAEYLRLSRNDAARSVIDAVSFGQQLSGVAQGRLVDGQAIQPLLAPTPAAANIALTPPTIQSQPGLVTAAQGGSAVFSIAITSAAPASYQWKFNTTNIAGATGSSLTLSNVQPASEGNYSAVASNAAGSTPSEAGALIVAQNFSQWATSKGLTGAGAAATADPDLDGVVNLFEFYFGLNPNVSATAAERLASLPQADVETISGTRYLTLTLRINRRALPIAAIFQRASALSPVAWMPAAPDLIEPLTVDPQTGDPRTRFKFSLGAGDSTGFVRLQLTP